MFKSTKKLYKKFLQIATDTSLIKIMSPSDDKQNKWRFPFFKKASVPNQRARNLIVHLELATFLLF